MPAIDGPPGLDGLRLDGRQQVTEGNCPNLDRDVRVLGVVGGGDGLELGDLLGTASG